MSWQDFSALFRQFSSVDNVVGVGHGHKWTRGEDTGQEAAVILVRKKYPRGDLKRDAVIPKKIDGIATDIIEVGDLRLLASERTEQRRPAQPGISIGHYKTSAGTFGAVVRDRSTGEQLILSNNHVLANLTNGNDGRSLIGDPILQPGLYDGGTLDNAVIGNLKRFQPVFCEVGSSQCSIANLFEMLINKCIGLWKPHYRIAVLRETQRENLVDCAVAAPAKPELIQPDIMAVGPVAGIKEPQIGMSIKKSGRSSGLTYSLVLATDVTVRVSISATEYGVFSDQVLAGPMSTPGDSGSLILSEDNHALGLLFAGSDQATMFNRIDHVLDALNVTL